MQDVKTLKDIPMRLGNNDSIIVAFRIKTGCLFVALPPAHKTIVIADCMCLVVSNAVNRLKIGIARDSHASERWSHVSVLWVGYL